MKKIIIIIFCNIIILLLIFAACEKYFYSQFCKIILMDYDPIPYWFNTDDILKSTLLQKEYPDRFHYLDKKYDKNPVLLIGCSYAYGQWLSEEENFSSKLSKLTSRPVYNLGVIGQDPTTSLMLLDKFSKDEKVTQKPEYIIYTYMFHHLQRLSNIRYYDFYRRKGYINSQKYNPLYHSFTYSYFQNRKLENILWNDMDYNTHQKIFFKIIRDMKKISDEKFPNSKFIVLLYDDIEYDLAGGLWNSIAGNEYKMNKMFEILDSSEFKKKFEDMGVTVLTTESLIGRKMDRAEDRILGDLHRPHPSTEAWDLVVPKLIKELEL